MVSRISAVICAAFQTDDKVKERKIQVSQLFWSKKLAFAEEWDNAWDDLDQECVFEGAKRKLIFIRHGSYHQRSGGDRKGYLDEIGELQARAVGRRLVEMHENGYTITRLQTSTMKRALHTMDCIKLVLENANLVLPPIEKTSLSCEGYPNKREPPTTSKHPLFQIFQDGARIEAYFRRMFYRPTESTLEKEVEVIVGHSNLHRWFIMRALQLPLWTYLCFAQPNGSFTEFDIYANGNVQLVSSGSAGHIHNQLEDDYKRLNVHKKPKKKTNTAPHSSRAPPQPQQC